MMDALLSKRLLGHTRVRRQNPPTQLGRSVLPRVNQIPNLFSAEIIHIGINGGRIVQQMIVLVSKIFVEEGQHTSSHCYRRASSSGGWHAFAHGKLLVVNDPGVV